MASAPSAPTPPNPITTATAQGVANVGTAEANTALQNPNVNSVLGSSTTTQTGSTQIQQPDGSWTTVPTYTQNQTLSPGQQTLYNQQVGLGQQENSIAKNALGSVSSALSNPVTGADVPGLTTSVGSGPNLATSYDPGGAIQGMYALGGPIQSSVPYSMASTDANQNTNAPTTFGAAGPIQGSLSTDYSAERDAATNAALARLQPNMDNQTSALESQLINQGVTQGSDAWNMGMLQNNQANNDLKLGAVATGDAEQQALFGEGATAGNFANAAQAQDYGEQLGRGTFAQSGIAQNNAAALNEANYGLSATGANNAAALNAGEFANAAQGQQTDENAALAAFGNTAQAQQNSENANAAAFGNTAQNQEFQNAVTGAGFGNQASNQSLQQQLALQQAPINEVSALASGGQATLPQFQGYSSGQIDQTPISSDTYNSAALANQQYQSQMGYAGSTNAGLYGLGASALGAGGTALGGYLRSDARLKKNAVLLGSSPIGIPVYAFHYITDDDAEPPFIGHMAQDVARVRPDAVAVDAAGWMSVNYGAL